MQKGERALLRFTLRRFGGGLLCCICSVYVLICCGFACCIVCRREKRLTEMKPLSHWRNGQGNRYGCGALFDEAVWGWGWILSLIAPAIFGDRRPVHPSSSKGLIVLISNCNTKSSIQRPKQHFPQNICAKHTYAPNPVKQKNRGYTRMFDLLPCVISTG